MKMTEPQNIALTLHKIAHQHPDQDVITAEDLSLTYEKLWKITERFGQKMRALGINRGSVVTINTSDLVVSVAAVFALSGLGATYFNLNDTTALRNRTDVTHNLRSPDRAETGGLASHLMDETWSPKYAAPDLQAADFAGFESPTDPCWILGSSGTTGTPKYISVDVRTLAERVKVVIDDYPYDQLRHLILFPCNSRPFPIRAIATILAKGVIIDSHSKVFMELHQVNMVSGSPRQVTQWLGDEPLVKKVRAVQCSGAKIAQNTIDHFLRSFETVEDVYGSNETILVYVTSHRINQNPQGRLVESEIEIVDELDEPLNKGKAGLLRIRSPHMVQSYYNDTTQSAKRFRNGWFYPGDTAEWDSDGLLKIEGRIDDVVSVGGVKINLAALDAAMALDAEVAIACCFANPIPGKDGELAACITPSRGITNIDAAKAAWAGAAGDFGPGLAPQTILVAPDLMLTHDGVPRRTMCRDLFMGQLTIASNSELRSTLFNFNPKGPA